jgi:hypothetical protein
MAQTVGAVLGGVILLAAAGLALRLLYLAKRRQPRAWHLAAEQLPLLAGAWGLRFERAGRLDQIGAIHGTYGGHPVHVLPDEQEVKIRIDLARRLEPADIARDGHDVGIGALALAPAELARRWRRRLHILRLTPTALECAPKEGVDDGARGLRYITADAVRELLPELVAIAARLDGVPGFPGSR